MPRNGTPGFAGSRLREAREARGLTAASLADLSGVSRQAVSQYEHEQVAPSPETLYAIASSLNLPVDFFLQLPRASDEPVVFFRSQAAATKGQRAKAEWRLRWLGDLVAYVEHFVSLPMVVIPEIHRLTGDGLRWTPVGIEEAAAEARRAWGIGPGPISHVVGLFERHGVIVTRGVVETDTIDSFSVRLAPTGRPAVFLGSDKDSAVRSRFDAAHEIGHHILHGDIDARRLMNVSERRALEDEAHAFASAFMLPAFEFVRDLRAPTLEGMLIAKPRWGVSVGAMIQRCADLEILRDDEAQRLWIARAKRGWSKREPLDDELPMEHPSLLAAAIDMLVQGGAGTRDQILTDIPLNAADIEALGGLPRDYLTEGMSTLRLLPRPSARPTPPRIGNHADVIDLNDRRTGVDDR